MNTKQIIFFITLLSFTLIGCRQNKQAANNTNTNKTTLEQTDFDQQITGKYWKLIQLEGKQVEMVENQEREIFFTLNKEKNTVGGFAGCNTITGRFELEEGNKISFTNMGITLMACPNIDVNETEFMQVFEFTNNYTIHNDTLSLNIGKRAPLAVFVAVYM